MIYLYIEYGDILYRIRSYSIVYYRLMNEDRTDWSTKKESALCG